MNFTNLLTTYRRTNPAVVFIQTFIDNLDHPFSVIALSETWTPQNKNSLFKSQKIDEYQPYYGKQGNSRNRGCGFHKKME